MIIHEISMNFLSLLQIIHLVIEKQIKKLLVIDCEIFNFKTYRNFEIIKKLYPWNWFSCDKEYSLWPWAIDYSLCAA